MGLWHSNGEEDVHKASQLLSNSNVQVNYLDEHDMTPLMYAAKKSKAEMCRLLLQHRADFSSSEHEYGYTAFMFAGLSAHLKYSPQIFSGNYGDDIRCWGRDRPCQPCRTNGPLWVSMTV
ncbi:ankyrin repeat and MYND domain-containing protein 2-like isoform X3 [Myxocyprinus asiaticus]|uniref:ankyrin repeat and MYND domain-containing protein 2-like isoform X3 n=1 Tax=Myxocyprinus asiaticus TaxID=70543 RepID=UPI002222C1BC|nr:ankyrin repeat and MYND domain-containing protein 2-like isoform X3 [Myxocyprinus asiaticus]